MDRAKVLDSLAATATTNDVVIIDRSLWAEIIDTVGGIADGQKDWPDLTPERINRLCRFPRERKKGELLRLQAMLRRSPGTLPTLAIYAYLRKAVQAWQGLDNGNPA